MNTEITDLEIFQVVEKLGADLKHDAKAASLIGLLANHIKTANTTEARIQKRVDQEYVFARAETSEVEPSNFIEFLVSTLARVGMLYEMARTACLSNDDVMYINARLGEAQAGSYVAEAAGVKIPTNTEVVEQRVAAGFEPMIDLAQRVLSVATPKARFQPERIAKLLEYKRLAVKQAEAVIANYDPMIEETFQCEVEKHLARATDRLTSFKATGVEDPSVSINPMFTHYEDQLHLDIDTLHTKQLLGSNDRQVADRAAMEVASLKNEIAELEQALAPIPSISKNAFAPLSTEG